MTNTIRSVLSAGLLLLAAAVLTGCVAIPPLINVQHRGDTPNSEVMRKLDDIEKRLNNLERKLDQKQ